jgi:hypothetical protein
VVEVTHGYGRHDYYLGIQEAIVLMEYSVLATAVIVLSTMFAKASICFLLLRLLGDAAAKKRKIFLYSLLVVLFVYNVVDVISLFVQCSPTRKVWNRKLPGTCWKPNVQEGFGLMQGGAFSRPALSVCRDTDTQELSLYSRLLYCPYIPS